MNHLLTTDAELDALYGPVNPNSLVKELDYLSDHYRAFVEHSPFVVLSTVGPEGLDASPRGDPPGFVAVRDRHTLLLPDRRGNNRIDSLRNLVRDPRVSLLFLVPGAGETLRVNGTAEISVDPALLERFEMNGKPPRCVLVVTIGRVYFQCQKALARSQLWSDAHHVAPGTMPSAGQILQGIKADFDGDAYDAAYPERMKKTIY